MRNLVLIFTLLLTCGFGGAALAENVTVATYNVWNMFDVFDDPYKDDQGTRVKPRHEIELVAAMVREMDADIVGFQEIENEFVLRAMVAEFLPDMGYDYIAALPSNDGRGITLGVISRMPIVKTSSYRWQRISDEEDPRAQRFARDLFRATIQVTEATTLDVFVVHFKAKGSRPGDPQSTRWRTAEAIRARDIIHELITREPDRMVILMGDYNSLPTDPAASAVFAPVNGQPVLFDLLADFPIEERITYPSTRFPNSAIDYIGVTANLVDKVVPGSVRVMPESEISKGSDHLPVIATFDLP